MLQASYRPLAVISVTILLGGFLSGCEQEEDFVARAKNITHGVWFSYVDSKEEGSASKSFFKIDAKAHACIFRPTSLASEQRTKLEHWKLGGNGKDVIVSCKNLAIPATDPHFNVLVALPEKISVALGERLVPAIREPGP